MPAATGFRAIRAGRIVGALLAAWAISLACLSLSAAPGQITVQVDQPGHRISPTLWGIFFEDINCSADGGIYAEMVRNRSFEDAEQPEHWSLVSSGSGMAIMAVVKEEPISQVSSNRNRQTLKLQVVKASRSAPTGISNEGFWGMSVQQGKKYELSFYARCDGGFRGPVTVQLQKPGGAVCASGEVTGLKGEWKKFKVTLTAKATEPAARLVLTVANPGTIWFDMVSLFPQETWKGRGLRTDLMEKLDALQAGVPALPGRLLGGRRYHGPGVSLEGNRRRYFPAADAIQHLAVPRHARRRLSRVSPDVRRPRRRTAVRDQLRHVAQGEHSAWTRWGRSCRTPWMRSNTATAR